MSSPRPEIGFKQVILIEWMEKAANLLLSGLGPRSIRRGLHEYLEDRTASGVTLKRSRNTQKFAVNMLMRIWVTVPDDCFYFRDRALDLFPKLKEDERIVLYWGLTGAVYPFWFKVAAHAGKLLSLQRRISLAQVQRRMKEEMGDREIISRNTRYVVRTFVAWKTLAETMEKGIYQYGWINTVRDSNMISWLAESLLLSGDRNLLNLKSLLNSPCLFPFQMAAITAENLISNSQQLEIVQNAVDTDLIMIRVKE